MKSAHHSDDYLATNVKWIFKTLTEKNWIKRNKVEMPRFLLEQRKHKCAEWKRTNEIGMNVSQGINFILDCCDTKREK